MEPTQLSANDETVDSCSSKKGVETGGASAHHVIDISKEENEQLTSLNEELERFLDIKNNLSTPPPVINLSPLECHALQLEEVEVLKAIFGDDIISLNDECSCFCVRIKFLSEVIREEDVIRIWFSLPSNYPCVPPVFEIESNQSGSFTFSEADELFEHLMGVAITRLGGTMLYELITLSQDHMQHLLVKKQATPTQVATETTFDTKEEKVDEELIIEKQEKDEILERDHYHPRMFVTISKIVSQLSSNVQITRIENVLRQDLAIRFQSCRMKLVDQLWKRERESPQQYMLSTVVGFHGTLSKSLPSIIQHGLVIPGSDNTIKVRCGSSLGLGIYLSPDPTFSLSYSDSSRLVVCAVVLGKVYKGGHFSGNYHSVISTCEKQWVIFNAAQVVPCYVIQIKEMSDNKETKQYNPPPLVNILHDRHVNEDNDKERRAKLLSRAQKYLPFGYGPGRTVILDAAEIDDDEEDYGDYQLLRYGDSTSRNGDTKVKEEHSELQTYRYKEREF